MGFGVGWSRGSCLIGRGLFVDWVLWGVESGVCAGLGAVFLLFGEGASEWRLVFPLTEARVGD